MEGLLRELCRPRRQHIHKLLVIISDQIFCFPKIRENSTSYYLYSMMILYEKELWATLLLKMVPTAKKRYTLTERDDAIKMRMAFPQEGDCVNHTGRAGLGKRGGGSRGECSVVLCSHPRNRPQGWTTNSAQGPGSLCPVHHLARYHLWLSHQGAQTRSLWSGEYLPEELLMPR